MAEELLAIIVLNWNRPQYSQLTIENVIKKTKVPYVLCLVDNNSLPETGVKDYLLGITKSNTGAQEVVHVFNNKNLGVANGRNSGICEIIEKRKIEPTAILNIDDDIILPDNFDRLLLDACTKVPKLGITGINVEPTRYRIVEINGVRVQLKTQGNLGGGALCLPLRVFKTVGYYGFGRGTLYALEDSMMKIKLDMLGLISAYILPQGVHLDKDKDKSYRVSKTKAHQKGSLQMKEFCKCLAEMRKTGNIYMPYTPPELFHPVDEDIFTNDLIIQDRKL